MSGSPPKSGLEYYEYIRRLDPNSSQLLPAVFFSRTFADLASRVIAAQCCISQEPVEIPPGLSLGALRLFLEDDPAVFIHEVEQATIYGAPGYLQLQLLAELAVWLKRHFDAENPAATSLQVWCPTDTEGQIVLFGPNSTALSQPPQPLRLAATLPLLDRMPRLVGGKYSVLAHYDLHGLSMLALTLRSLRRLGAAQVDCAMSFEWTGDISKLWKRAVARAINSAEVYDAVIMVDCSVHSRNPDHTLKALSRLDNAPNTSLLIIDHHADTIRMAPQLMRERCMLVLTDVYSCGLCEAWDTQDHLLSAIGAISDKVPEVAHVYNVEAFPELNEAVTEYSRRHLEFSPTPPVLKEAGIYPLHPLWEALADGRELTAALATELLGPSPPAEIVPEAAIEKAGGLIVFTETIQTAGRAWYSILEERMRASGVSYAICLRLLDDKKANLLLLTDWLAVSMPPIRSFIPEKYLPQCLGHPAAVWADLPKDQALLFLTEVIEAINNYCDSGPDVDLDYLLDQVNKNILSAKPVRTDNPSAGPAGMG